MERTLKEYIMQDAEQLNSMPKNLDWVRDNGALMQINRRLLHPLGLVLVGLQFEDSEAPGLFYIAEAKDKNLEYSKEYMASERFLTRAKAWTDLVHKKYGTFEIPIQLPSKENVEKLSVYQIYLSSKYILENQGVKAFTKHIMAHYMDETLTPKQLMAIEMSLYENIDNEYVSVVQSTFSIFHKIVGENVGL